MPSLGPTELIVLFAVILLLFGGSRLPRLARSMGEASREFRRGLRASDADNEQSHD